MAKDKTLDDEFTIDEEDEFSVIDEEEDEFSTDEINVVEDTDDSYLTESIFPSKEDADLFGDLKAISEPSVDPFGDADGLGEYFNETIKDNASEAVNRIVDELVFEEIKDDHSEIKLDKYKIIEDTKKNELKVEIEKSLINQSILDKFIKKITYVIIGLSSTAIAIIIGCFVVFYNTKANVLKLTKDISAIELNIVKISKDGDNLNDELSSAIQLNKKTSDLINEMTLLINKTLENQIKTDEKISTVTPEVKPIIQVEKISTITPVIKNNNNAKISQKPLSIVKKPVNKIVLKDKLIKKTIVQTFKQEWLAKSKSAEFTRKGLFSEVVPIRDKNSTLYQVQISEFKKTMLR